MSTAQLSPLPAARIPFATTEITAAAQKSVAKVLKSGWVTTGPEVVEFEKEFGEWVGAPHAVAVASCTTAIELSLRALEPARRLEGAHLHHDVLRCGARDRSCRPGAGAC